jgi:hypothetical protein
MNKVIWIVIGAVCVFHISAAFAGDQQSTLPDEERLPSVNSQNDIWSQEEEEERSETEGCVFTDKPSEIGRRLPRSPSVVNELP